MCAIPDKKTTDEFRSRKGPQRAYKVIRKRDAMPCVSTISVVPYRPGRNVDARAVKTYLGYVRGTQRGFHCLLSRKDAIQYRDGNRRLTVVCVTYDPADMIVAESTHWGDGIRRGYRQVVVRALHISKRAWKQAGLPVR